MRGRSLICIAFAWVCSFCKGKQSFRLSSLIYKWNCHVSTHGSRRGSRHVPASRTFGWIFVSTHGSLAGADRGQNDCRRGRCCFNSRLPCGSRPWMPGQVCNSVRFNSRLPCGSRHNHSYPQLNCVSFQLTAPLREPTMSYQICLRRTAFQLTAPLREPTIFDFDHSLDDSVSTHGSLAGADPKMHRQRRTNPMFQLTAPLREPTIFYAFRFLGAKFQLTAPLREPT